MNPTTMNKIIQAVAGARKKQPHFADSRFHAVSLLAEEAGEFARAVNDGRLVQAEAEALDAIAVLVRFLEGR